MREKSERIIIKFIFVMIVFLSTLFLCISSLINSYEISKLNKFVSQMELIQEKVNLIRREYRDWDEYDANENGNFYAYLQYLEYPNASKTSNLYVKDFNGIINELNLSNIDCWDKNTDSIIANYCYFTPESLERYFGIKDVNLYVIINFYTGNVIAKDGVQDPSNENKLIYRQYDTKLGNKLTIVNFNDNLKTIAKVVENNGLSQKIKISFNSDNSDKNNPNILEVYYYSDENEIRKNCNEFQEYIYSSAENAVYFNVNTSGKYSFFIRDTNYIEYKKAELEIKLCNKPILFDGMKGIYWDTSNTEVIVENENNPNWYNYSSTELRFANAKTEDGNYWVWIPRYIYNKNKEYLDIEFANESSSNPTNNKNLKGYKLQEAFSKNDNITGFWVAKFQINSDYGNNIIIRPGKSLTIVSAQKAMYNSENFVNNSLKNYTKLISINERNSVLLLSEYYEIKISNDLIHYSGGGINEDDYISNMKYSSTGNVYGVYDLITSENEITRDSSYNEEGRYRFVLKNKGDLNNENS